MDERLRDGADLDPGTKHWHLVWPDGRRPAGRRDPYPYGHLGQCLMDALMCTKDPDNRDGPYTVSEACFDPSCGTPRIQPEWLRKAL